MSDSTIALTESTFDSTIASETKPVLVDFWAEWCGPCRMVGPILEELAKEYSEQLVIAKVNVDQNPSISPRFGVRGIPTLILFKDGNVVATQVGALSKLQLKTFLDNHIN